MIEKEYYNIQISDNNFKISKENTKPKEHGSAVDALKKIETILSEKLECAEADKEYMNLPKEILYSNLKEKAQEIKENYKNKQKGFFNRLFVWFSAEGFEISQIYSHIDKMTENVLSKRKDCLQELAYNGHIPEQFLEKGAKWLSKSLEKINEGLQKPEDKNTLKNAFSLALLTEAAKPLFDESGSISSFAQDRNKKLRRVSDQSIKFLLAHGADVNQKDMNGMTPLAHACKNGNLALVELLIKSGADMNIKDNNHNTPLHHAAFNQHIHSGQIGKGLNKIEQDARLKIVDLLPKEQVNEKNIYGLSPIAYACETIQEEIVEKLVPYCDEENRKQAIAVILNSGVENDDIGYHQRQIYNSLELSKDNILKNLLSNLTIDANEKAIFPNCEAEIRNTPLLHIAINNRYANGIKQLVEKGNPDVRTKDNEGNTPLHLASKHQNFFESKDFDGKTAYQFLRDKLGDTNETNLQGITPSNVTHLPPLKKKNPGSMNRAFYYPRLSRKFFLPEP